MRAQDPVLSSVLCILIGGFTATQASAQSTTGAKGEVLLPGSESPNAGSPHFTEKQLEYQRKGLEAISGVQREAAAMVPGRTWTWQLNAEQSREHLDVLGHALNVLRDNEALFEASLTPEQKTKFASQFQSIHEILQHILGDAQSLDDELQKGYPTRWHVAHDISDLQDEIRRLRKLHEQIARGGASR